MVPYYLPVLSRSSTSDSTSRRMLTGTSHWGQRLAPFSHRNTHFRQCSVDYGAVLSPGLATPWKSSNNCGPCPRWQGGGDDGSGSELHEWDFGDPAAASND